MKILFAEDDRDLSSVIVRVLQYNKFDVQTAYDGAEALELLENEKFDVLVLDIMMPKIDGITVLKRLRERGNPIPILLLTALAETDDKVSGLDAGADDYLTKPFVIKELLARIRAIARRSSELQNSYSIGNLTLNPNTFELQAQGHIRLTNKEYRLMELLIRNKNILLSTERLMEEVWELDSEAEINTVWVFISSLRKKLTQIQANYTIKAVRGVGYRLEKLYD